MIIRVDFNVLHATLASVGFGLPRPVQQLDAPEFRQINTAPLSNSAARLHSAIALASILVPERSILAWLVMAKHMGDKTASERHRK
jgi:hypothetical protein